MFGTKFVLRKKDGVDIMEPELQRQPLLLQKEVIDCVKKVARCFPVKFVVEFTTQDTLSHSLLAKLVLLKKDNSRYMIIKKDFIILIHKQFVKNRYILQ